MNRLILLFTIVAVLFSCKRKPYKVDLSNVKIDITIQRFEKDLFKIDFQAFDSSIAALSGKYSEFFKIFNQGIIRVGHSTAPEYRDRLHSFITNLAVKMAYEKVNKVFPDLDSLDKELERAFKHYHYYFPGKLIPEAYTYISGFNQSMVVADSILAIGLDKYLGKNSMVYEQLMVDKYLRKTMRKEMIVSDCMKAWGSTEFPLPDSVPGNVLSNILFHGKVVQFQRQMMPGVHDTLLLGFTEVELEWCEKYERMMWEYLIENNLLYEMDYMVINKLVNPAPYTSYFTRESPGRAAIWLGWNIVKEYMKAADVGLEELMSDHDYQKMLRESRYRPR